MENTNTPKMNKKNFKVGGIYDVEYMTNADLRHPVKIVKMTEKTGVVLLHLQMRGTRFAAKAPMVGRKRLSCLAPARMFVPSKNHQPNQRP